MCGIAGILRIHPPGQPPPPPLEAIPEHWLDILDDSIKHRGPDGKGRFRDRATRPDGHIVDVALVHRRLSILDHAGGHQPMVSVTKGAGILTQRRATGPTWLLYESPDDAALHVWNNAVAGLERGVPGGRPPGLSTAAPSPASDSNDLVAVAFNGCIYNHRTLRHELQAQGHTFTTNHSDTEVLVHGWRQWGPQLFDRTEGMYAVATWSHATAALWLSRDQFGEKPLDVATSPDGSIFAFCSTEAGLTRLWFQAKVLTQPIDTIDAASLRGWIQYGWNQSSPLVASSSKHYPGVCERLGGPRDGAWRANTVAGQVLQPGNRQLTVESVDSSLRAAVQSRLDADVPLGTFLSGGIDSALITCFARETRPDLTAYTVRMPEASFDESAAAAHTAASLGVRHEILDCSLAPASDLTSTIQQLGLPFGDSSMLPMLWVSRAARSAVRVALSGDGGDELFMGYDRHRAFSILKRLHSAPRAALNAAAILATRAANRPRTTRADRLLNAVRYDGYKELVAVFPTEHTWDLGLRPRGSSGFSFDSIKHWGMTMLGSADHIKQARRFDLCFYLPEDLLRKSDTASMACALEVRSPFLDSALARQAIDADICSLMPNGERKGLLKQVARKYLPAEIVDRPKQGFAIPIGDWFRSDFGGLRQLLHDHLLAPEPFGPDALGINAMINMDYVRQMLKEHDDAGTRSLWPWKGRDHSQRLYMLLVLSIWAKWLGSLPAPSKATNPAP